jgi:hypothetical protein
MRLPSLTATISGRCRHRDDGHLRPRKTRMLPRQQLTAVIAAHDLDLAIEWSTLSTGTMSGCRSCR